MKISWSVTLTTIYLLAVGGTSLGQESRLAKVFAEGVLPSTDNFAPAFTPDGKTFFFTMGLVEGGGFYESRFREGTWSTPEKIDFSRGEYNDVDLFPAPDGKRYYFMSKRPTSGTSDLRDDQDIWVVERHGDRWQPPEHLGSVVNSDARDGYPTVTADGTLYFFSEREQGAGQSDIYRSRFSDGEYSDPENLGPMINTEHWDGLPYITPDEKVLVFFSTRPGGYGGGDLYVSYARDGGWTTPQNLGPAVNTEVSEVTPHIDPAKRTLFFARRDKVERKRIIYHINIDETPIKF